MNIKIKIITMLLAMVFLTACGSGENPKIEQAKEAVRFNLIDGMSAEFAKVEYRNLVIGGETVCGYVNGKNRLGAYTGMTPFIYKLKNDKVLFKPKTKDEVLQNTFHTLWKIDCNTN